MVLAGKKIAYHLTLFAELTNGGVDLLTGEVVDWEILDNFPVFSIGTNGEGSDKPFLGIVATVGSDTDTVPVTFRCGGGQDLTVSIAALAADAAEDAPLA